MKTPFYKKNSSEQRLNLKAKQRLSHRMVYMAATCLIALATISRIVYMQFADVDNASGKSNMESRVGSRGMTPTLLPTCNSLLPVDTSFVVTITAKGNTSLCEGSGLGVQLCASSGVSYYWSPYGETTQCITKYNPGYYIVKVTNSSGQSDTAGIRVTISYPPDVTVTANGPTTFCQGDSLVLIAGGALTYIWSNGDTTSTIKVGATGTYTVTGTSSVGCTASASISDTANANPVISINTSSTTPGCNTAGNTFSATVTGGGSYLWSVSSSDNSWTITSGQGTSAITYMAGNCGTTGEFKLTATNSSTGCSSTDSINLTDKLICDNMNPIVSNFNGTGIAFGNYIWFNSVVKVNNNVHYPLTIQFINQNIKSADFNLSPPTAELILSDTVTQATTIYNGTEWVTTAQPNLSGNYFLSGYSYLLPAAIPGGLNPVTWTGAFTTSDSGVTLQWQWAAAVYKPFSSNLNALGVKPVDDNKASYYQNSNHAGTPENYKNYLVGGARGGSGANYTGSYSATGNPDACVVNTTTDKPETESVMPSPHVIIMNAYPNPFTDQIHINYSIPRLAKVDIQISNSFGQVVNKETVYANKGANTYSLSNMQELSPGVYIVNVVSNGKSATRNIIKQ